MRGKAQNDSPYNDSVFVQFSGSVDANGMPAFLIGTPDATCMNLEDCLGCGLQAWGWQDNGWGVGAMGPAVYFAATGLQTLRVQVREDGLSIDQIVLSPQSYLTSAPGLLKNDTAILPESTGLTAPSISAISPNSGPVTGGTSVVISGQGFVAGTTVKFGGVPAASTQVSSGNTVTAVTASHSAGTVDVVVTNPDGRSASIAAGYVYAALPSPPTVTVLFPNGGETFLFNSNCNISWSASGGSPRRYEVFWSSNGGSTWTVLASNLSATSNSFVWRVPKQQTTSGRIKVRLTDASGAVVEDISNNNFSIRKR